jgi:predicted hydrocarbon binding protein
MNHIPCRERSFPFRINLVTFYGPYLRWLRHLGERLGFENTRLLWESTFADYDENPLIRILSSGWHRVTSGGGDQVENGVAELWAEYYPKNNLELSIAEARNILENTPPVFQIKRCFSLDTVEKATTAYDALHLRFDGLACLAESLIENYGKQGELIVYDLMVEGRLSSGSGERGSVEEFIENFCSIPDTPNLFTAGLEAELISKANREAVMYVHECEWARYFKECHPRVGYLMACSTDEVAYKAFNKRLRLRRTKTIMEGGEKCDFRIYAICDDLNSGE